MAAVKDIPAILSPLTLIILSPPLIPAIFAGPPSIGATIITPELSFDISTKAPIP